MKGKIVLSSPLCKEIGSSEADWELAKGATVSNLIEYLNKRFPQLIKSIEHTLILINGHYAPVDALLNDGDEITILPIIGGG